jgi:polyketide cyclase/dehydrase/lipid transport protein
VPRIHFKLGTRLSPDEVVRALTDFSAHRAEVWRNIDSAHLKVHDQGPGWADVTEGNSLAGGVWERSRYEWGKEPGRVTTTTLDSNVWSAGDGWTYRVTPATGGGSTINVDVARHGKGAKGALIAAVLSVAGARMLREDMRRVLAPLETGLPNS